MCLYKQLSTAFNAAFDPLAHLGEHPINNADGADFHLPEIGSLLGASTPPARPSHKVRETQIHFPLRQPLNAAWKSPLQY
jgi:hypothetical protein